MKGVAGENLLQLLERRLDNVIYRLGSLRITRGRQLVRHGHFLINGHKVDIPSFLCGRVIRSRSATDPRRSRASSRASAPSIAAGSPSGWSWTRTTSRQADRAAGREDLTLPIREQLIVELYSR